MADEAAGVNETPTTLAQAFGQRLSELRVRAKLSQNALATRSGLVTIRKLELGSREPRLVQILGLCHGLKVSPNVLLRGLYEKAPEDRPRPQARKGSRSAEAH
jgi:transcriptional regulator with XRE-family HTH domain